MAVTLTRQVSLAASPYVLALKDDLSSDAVKRIGRFALGDLDVEVSQGRASLWCLVRGEGEGGFALRTAHFEGGVDFACRKLVARPGEALRVQIDSSLGRHLICFATGHADLHRLRMTVRFTPATSMRLPYCPRDLYPLDRHDNPLGARGNVEAAQRGHAAGLVYLRLDEPQFGSILYFQNFTALNPYFLATGTTPDGVVGGTWPELGYQAPTPETHDAKNETVLRAGTEYVLSDAIVVVRDCAGDDEQDMARQFLQMLGVAYKALDLPAVEYRDWEKRARSTLRDLETAEQARRTEYGHIYLMPYPDGEFPDSMVQLSVTQALHEYEMWLGRPLALKRQLMQALKKFHDPKAGLLRRYLPSVGERQGKDPDAVDSWYLYHPMLNLGRLALRGDDDARALLLATVEYGIKAAQHFDYAWPIMYKLQDFAVIRQSRGDQRFGQTDVGGIYAYTMLQAFELTGEDRFIREARAAIDKAKGLRFDLLYQANLTVWGAVACLKLWRITSDADYLMQSYAYLAGFFHNAIIWDSNIGTARHFKTFLGVNCLHDSPYMAMYECFESFAGFEEFLDLAGPKLEPSARMLISEYCKYGLDRAWFYFPDTLPPDAIQQADQQSGVVNPKLSFPLEDLYPDGQAAGQIGQEIYGSGGAFVFATRSHHPVDGAPFRLYCDHFIRARERTGDRALSISLDGGETCIASISLVRLPRKKLTKVRLRTIGGDPIKPMRSTDDRIDFAVPAFGRIILTWQ